MNVPLHKDGIFICLSGGLTVVKNSKSSTSSRNSSSSGSSISELPEDSQDE